MEKEIQRIGGFYGQSTRWGVYSSQGIAPTLVSAMGEGGGHTPMVVEIQKIRKSKNDKDIGI